MTTAALSVVTPADELPITLPDAKAQLRVTHAFDDAHIQNLIYAATAWAQEETRRLLVDTVVEIRSDRFPFGGEAIWWSTGWYRRSATPTVRQADANARDRSMFLPGGKVSAVESIKYIDTESIEQTLSGPTSGTPGTDYQEDLTDADFAFVMPAAGSEWPAVLSDTVNAITIRFTAGFGANAEEIPQDIKQAIRFRVADLYVVRDSTDAGSRSEFFDAAENLLAPHRILVF